MDTRYMQQFKKGSLEMVLLCWFRVKKQLEDE